MDQVENTVMQDRVFKALLNEQLLEQLVKDHHVVHFEHALESIEIIVDWLKYRAMVLGYIEQRLEKGIILKSSSSSKQKQNAPLSPSNKPKGAFGGGHQTRSGKTYVIQENGSSVEDDWEQPDNLESSQEEESSTGLTFQNSSAISSSDINSSAEENSDSNTITEEILSENDATSDDGCAIALVNTGKYAIPECPCCKQIGKLEKHFLIRCPTLVKLSCKERHIKLYELKLCYNCFSNKHGVAECDRPPKCTICVGNHHTLLHREGGKEALRKPTVKA
jgi:hypothetical protein